MEIIKGFFKGLKIFYLILIFGFASLALYVKITNKNPVDDFLSGNKFETIRKLNIPKNVFNNSDQTIETDLGRLQMVSVNILKGAAVTEDGGRKDTIVISYKFTPKKDNIKTNLLFDEQVKVLQNSQQAQPAVFFQGGVDDTVINSVNKSVELVQKDQIGKEIVASSAFVVDPGRVDVSFANKTTPYFVTGESSAI